MTHHEHKIVEFRGGFANGKRQAVPVGRSVVYGLLPRQVRLDGITNAPVRFETYEPDGTHAVDGTVIVRIRTI